MRTSLYGAIESHLKRTLSQLYTCTPAIVDKYDPDTCTVDVYPAIYHTDKDGIDTQEPLLEKVPLHFQATRELGLTFPVRKGDTVLLVFGMSDAESWLQSNKEYDYATTRRSHDINDAYAIAGIFKYNRSPVQAGTEEDLNIRYNGSYIRLKSNGDIIADTSNGQSVELKSSGDVNVDAGTKVTVTAPEVEINSATKIDMVAPTVTIDADEINFGGVGGAGIARVGDLVQVSSGSSAGQWPIITGSNVGKLL